jgi:hypothetical protein
MLNQNRSHINAYKQEKTELKQCTREDGEDDDAKGDQRHVKRGRDKTAKRYVAE